MVVWSGRTEESITVVLDRLQTQPLDAEYVALLHNIQSEETPGYIFRGYGLYRQNENKNAELVAKEVQHYNGLKRPVVWVFSGMLFYNFFFKNHSCHNNSFGILFPQRYGQPVGSNGSFNDGNSHVQG